MTAAEFRQMRRGEDKLHLEQMEALWLRFELLKLLEPNGFDRIYYGCLEQTAWEEITKLESKMVRRHL